MIRVLNSFDPDQARHYVGPDLGPNCFHLGYQKRTKEGKEINVHEHEQLSSGA